MKKILYHVTPEENVPSILKKGLIPDGAFVSLSTNPYSWWKEGLVILEVNIKDLSLEKQSWLPKLDEITVWGRIDPYRIKVSKYNKRNKTNEPMKKPIIKNANDYQRKAHSFACYGDNPTYAFAELAEESGEALGKYAKFIRKHGGQEPSTYRLVDVKQAVNKDWVRDNIQFREDLKKELGDICWGIAEICSIYGFKLQDILQKNIDKLTERKQKGVIVGSGDTTAERLKNAQRG